MAIVKKRDSLKRVYYINTTTGKRTTEASYNRSSSAKKTLAPFMARSGKPSKDYCSTAGRTLKKRPSSRAGRALRSCK